MKFANYLLKSPFVAVLGVLLTVLFVQLWAQQQIPGTIRVQVDVVPLDVVVTDNKDQPVLDLSKEDFLVLENGIPQEITHFLLQRFDQPERLAKEPETTPSVTVPSSEGLLDSPPHRTFLVLLGRGRHRNFKPLKSLIQFVREELTPTDRVAVIAYNRSTNFSTEHQKTAAVLESYSEKHEEIEAALESRLGGLAAIYGSKRFSSVQPKIDEIFDLPQVVSRRVIAGNAVESPEHAEDEREALALAERMERRAQLEAAFPEEDLIDPAEQNLTELQDLELELLTDLPLDEYMEGRTRTGQDLMNIYAAIDYLRFSEGEKHILFFTEKGLFLPDQEDEESVSKLASDARVRLHNIHTGGLELGAAVQFRRQFGSTRTEFNRATAGEPRAGGSFTHTMALSSLRQISSLTGGRAYIGTDVTNALRSINRNTRAVYLLGYRPKDDNFDGKFRRIQVRVRGRKGLKVQAREGYYARTILEPYDLQRFLTYSRTVSAATYSEPVNDIVLSFDVTKPVYKDETTEFDVSLRILLASSMFTLKDQLYEGQLAVTFFLVSDKGQLVTDAWDKLELSLTPPTYRKVLAQGIPLTRHFSVAGRVTKGHLKVVVYDTA
ncbi:VWA domain-containing protein, partial [Acidobacteria bacterium AH-259-O06]|nr:VWA domain-containing protein [Acidobacteria bacterium AH-259-O06]